MILITGATGRVGRHLVPGLLAEGAPVRALTRDPAAADLPAGAEVARFDPDRPETMTAAVAGATAVFINATAVGRVIAPLMDAAAKAGVRRAVLLSSLQVSDNGDQPYALGAQHKALEDAVTASGLEATFLRCGMFAGNTLSWWAPQVRAQGVIRTPYLDAAVAPVAERDIAAAAVRVLLDDGHAGQTYALTGPQSLTHREQVQAIGQAIGRDVRAEELPPEIFKQFATNHMPATAADDLLRYYANYVGRTAETSTDLEKITGRPGTTFPEWAKEHADSFR